MRQQLQQVFGAHAEVTLHPVTLQGSYHLPQSLPPYKHMNQRCLSATCKNIEISSGNTHSALHERPASRPSPLGTQLSGTEKTFIYWELNPRQQVHKTLLNYKSYALSSLNILCFAPNSNIVKMERREANIMITFRST